MAGVHIFSDEGEDGVRAIYAGPFEQVRRHVEGLGGFVSKFFFSQLESITASGDTALLVCEGMRVLGLIHFYGAQRNAISSIYSSLRHVGIEIIALATTSTGLVNTDSLDAERKLLEVRVLQNQGKRVAYLGHCPSDRPALAQADLKLVASYSLDLPMMFSDVTNVRGEHRQFKHLFRLGHELKICQNQSARIHLSLSAVTISISTLLVYLYLTDGQHSGSQLLSRHNAGLLISIAVIFLYLGIYGVTEILFAAILGVHERRGIKHQISSVIFSNSWTPSYFLIVSILSITLIDGFLWLLMRL